MAIFSGNSDFRFREQGNYRKKLLLAQAGIFLILLFTPVGCNKFEAERLVLIHTLSVGEITGNSCVAAGSLLDLGEPAGVDQHGFVWSTSPEPENATNFVRLGPSTSKGAYTGLISGLAAETRYYVRAYAEKGAVKQYGNEVSFTTGVESSPPQVTTGSAEEISWDAATVFGNVIDDGGSEVTERGICWAMAPDPTTDEPHLASGAGLGEFAVAITGLVPETSYNARAYAINSGGISYGGNREFTTLPFPSPPEVVTGNVTTIEPSGVFISNSSILSDGGAPILSKGLCWNTEPNPSIDNASLEYGPGPEAFSMEIQGLEPDTEYYIRAYATNGAEQTGYGEDLVVKTLFLCGSVLQDTRDGKEYSTVQIGEQCWMAQNLNTGVLIDTSSLFGDNGTVEKMCYDNNSENCSQYGALYSWYEMMQYTEQEGTQGVCPSGWHLPADAEWKVLELQLGMAPESADSTGWRGYSNEGGKLKSTDPLWSGPNVGATNASQFTSLPSGMVWSNGQSTGIGEFALYWTSTPTTEELAWYRYLHTNESRIYRVEGYRANTTTVRCVKD